MSKSLDDRFEQARQQLRAELPLEQLAQRLAAAPKPSFWTFKKIIGMNSFLLSIITAAFYWQSMPFSTPVLATNTTLPDWAMVDATPPNAFVLDTLPPTPVAPRVQPPMPPQPVPPPRTVPPPRPPVAPIPPRPPRPIAPQKTFTEYTLEISKDNSEQQLQKLQQELEQYGIQMHIDKLTYRPNGTIKRFKGQFDTDSLFCGEAIQAQTFDVSGNFQAMSFTFRVAESNNQLKYLKIAMDDEVEQTIECYEDEVLSDAKEAQRLYFLADNERSVAIRAKVRAQRDLERVHADIARAKTNYIRFKSDSIANFFTVKADSLPLILERYTTHFSVDHLLDSLRPGLTVEYWNGEDLDSAQLLHELRVYEDRLRFELRNWEQDHKVEVLRLLEKNIESPVMQELEINLNNIEELEEELEINLGDMDILKEELELKLETIEAAQLEQEAKRLQQEAKALQRAAKMKAKLAKIKAKEAKRRAKQRADESR